MAFHGGEGKISLLYCTKAGFSSHTIMFVKVWEEGVVVA